MQRLIALAMVVAVAGCTKASPVMDTGGGTYFVSTYAAPAAGGTAGAYGRAQEEATKFCATRSGHPVMVAGEGRDIYRSGYGGGLYSSGGTLGGGFSGGTDVAGAANVRFRCE